MSVVDRLVAFLALPAYALRRSRVAGVSAYGALLFACLAIAAYSVLRGWFGRFTTVRVVAGALSLGVAAVLLLSHMHRYLVFRPRPFNVPEGVRGLEENAKLRVRGSGLFAVSDMSRYLVEVPAFFWSTRLDEHILAAQIQPFRVLGAGVPAGERGWWYVFLEPRRVVKAVSGELGFGLRVRPAVRVIHRTDKGQKSLYLSCDSEDELAVLLTQLQTTSEMAWDEENTA
jgi:hypothetical protein